MGICTSNTNDDNNNNTSSLTRIYPNNKHVNNNDDTKNNNNKELEKINDNNETIKHVNNEIKGILTNEEQEKDDLTMLMTEIANRKLEKKKRKKSLKRERTSIADWKDKSNLALIKIHSVTKLRRERTRLISQKQTENKLKKQKKKQKQKKRKKLTRQEEMVMLLTKSYDEFKNNNTENDNNIYWKDNSFNLQAQVNPGKKIDQICHVTDMNLKGSSPMLFPTGDHSLTHDIMQGELGDCYFISALSVLADRPSRIKNIFGYTENAFNAGISVVSVNHDGIWEYVLLDHYFPCNENKNPVFSKSRKGKHILWVSLVEKAYAKLHSSYEAIESGTTSESLRALTGAPCVYYNLHDETNKMHYCDKEKLWGELTDAKENNFMICTSTHANTNNKKDDENFKKRYGLVRGHAYALLDVVKPKNANFERMVKIRNPWGRDEWKGAYSDHSSEWTDELLDE